MFKLFRYLKPYKWQCFILVAAIAAQVWLGLRLPALMAEIVNIGIVGQDMGFIYLTGVKMVAYALLASILSLVADYESAKIGTAYARDLRDDFYKKVISFSVSEIDDFSTASLITRTTSDISTVQQAVIMCLSMLLRAPMTAVVAVIAAVTTAADMTWIIGIAIAIIFVTTISLMALAMPRIKIGQKLLDKLTGLTRENLTGLRVVRAFNNQEKEAAKFNDTTSKFAKNRITIELLMSVMHPMVMLTFNGMTLLCAWVGIGLMNTDISYLGNMMAFAQYAGEVVMSFLILTMLFVIIPQASVSAKRINEVMNKANSVKWKTERKGKTTNEASVEFKKVSFKYPGAEGKVLDNISFKAKAGETTAFIGSTGSGKSTLINLVPRFYEATSGEILVDGKNAKDYTEDELMNKIGYVPQKGKLFSGTVKSNILFGVGDDVKDAERERRMKLAAKVAQADEFIKKMDKKYDSHIAQGGTNVSGGQKQRLSIARAIAKQPKIYIFDDAFSALDMKTDAKLRQALKPETKDAVVLIVAQRISTIRDAEQIIVLDNGKVVGKGTHKELLKKCKVYNEIVKSQVSEEEYAKEVKNA